ncbi:MAG: murein biosynthesis integral membrane protein MurJ [Microthrixaceae bacterium]|nr:murein biosynthesis integral membrane protein MurJ [Microthrixaceae bacterium]
MTDDSSARRAGRESLFVAAGTALSRLTGFARVFVLAYAIGQSELADLYNLANSAPNLVYELVVGGVLSATLVPLFVRARTEHDDESTSVMLSVGFVASVVLSVVALAGTAVGEVVGRNVLSGPGHDAESLRKLEIIVDLLYLTFPQILFYAVTSLSTAYLNASRMYRTAAFAPVLTNLVSIVAFMIVGLRLQGEAAILDATQRDLSTLLWLGLGTTAGVAAMSVPLMWAVRRGDIPIRFAPQFRHRAVRQVVRLSGWTFGYVVANQLALLTVLVLLPDNKRYSDAFIFFQLPHGLIAVSIMTTMTPELASAAARSDYQALADRFGRGLRLLAALIVPAAIGYVLLATPITSFLQRGNLTAEDARLTGRAVAAFAIGLPAFSAYLFACRGFYALSDTRTPFWLNAIENGINLAGVVGLAIAGAATSTSFALAYSVAYLLAAALAIWRFERRLRELDGSVSLPPFAPIARMAVAALGMGVVVWLVRLVLHDDSGTGAVAAVMVGVLAGGVTYFALTLALGIEEAKMTLSAARRRLRI